MIRWLINRWHARQRAIDLRILWPACCANARDLDHAKAAFAAHVFHDEAWREFSPDALYSMIDTLQMERPK